MLQRFRAQHPAGRKLVLLYCGDHDPAGLRISDVIKQNLMDCARVQDVGFDPTPIEVVRFGLNRDQIARLGLTWIDNLITGSGKDLADPRHPDHNKPYVQDYIATHGLRKVEANALARDPAAAAAMVEAAINQYFRPTGRAHTPRGSRRIGRQHRAHCATREGLEYASPLNTVGRCLVFRE